MAEDDGRAGGGQRGRGDRPRGRESSRRLPRGRRLASVPRHRRPRLRPPDVAGRPGRDRLGARAADAARRGGLGARRGRPAGRVRAAVRVLEHPPWAALRARAGRSDRRAAARLGALGRPARSRARPSSGGVRRQEPVLDGLVLPRARRRAARRRRRRAARGGLGRLRRARPRRPLRQRPALGDRGRDLRAGPLPGRLRPARPGGRGLRHRAQAPPRRRLLLDRLAVRQRGALPGRAVGLDLRRRDPRRRRPDRDQRRGRDLPRHPRPHRSRPAGRSGILRLRPRLGQRRDNPRPALTAGQTRFRLTSAQAPPRR